ncbi:uncharacterized protein PHACADRAFT_201364 [Phanerochaete carnosa HHB-10118-sp]|uniref:Uncharacterized protein n=1 Tax=Phanerochaete carnosa (strain HHB-10118-sp) TaxID=650164 RepID=K5VSW5_PHACS|nr:uncharacterized protein PHACADRAFT_201364 [Phanerochaete carnosa HHB-10118-sp]EKM49669.1 hypothetical protein PHACADRAFT_201364 [Phanerochaete carnosa HHB-10118-sp]
MSEAASSLYAPRQPPQPSRSHHHAQPSRAGSKPPRLFDPRKDNQHHFGVMARPQPNGGTAPTPNGCPAPTPKSSGDWMSASSTSSYAHSTISSNFTLNTTTTESSVSLALFNNRQRSEDSAALSNVLLSQLKLYQKIVTLEAKLQLDHDVDMLDDTYKDSHQIGLLQKGQPANTRTKQEEKAEQERYHRTVQDHKELANVIHQLLCVTLSPNVPVLLRNIPIKYNLVTRLWLHAFYRLLESLRRAAILSAHLDIALENLVEFIYYTYSFYTGLMDKQHLVHLRSNWTEHLRDITGYRITATALLDNQAVPKILLAKAIIQAALSGNHLSTSLNTPEASELSNKNFASAHGSPASVVCIDDSPPPSVGKFAQAPSIACMMELKPEECWQQISRERHAKGPAGMIALHPFSTSREAVLLLWSQVAQSRRQASDASLTDLFVLLPGMIPTDIQLNNFKGVLVQFEEEFQIEVNISEMLEYGRSTAFLRRVSGIMGRDTISGLSASPILNGRVKVTKRPENEESQDSLTLSEADAAPPKPELPTGLPNFPRTSAVIRPIPNPYITITFTFLAMTLENKSTKDTPQEDWCMCSFWDKATCSEKSLESEALDNITQAADAQDGVIEDDAENDEQAKLCKAPVHRGLSPLDLCRSRHGEWSIESWLTDRITCWQEDARFEKPEEAWLEKLEKPCQLMGTRWDNDRRDGGR